MTKEEISLLPLQVIAGVEYKHESYEEWVFAAWVKNLYELGVIKNAGRPKPVHVSDPLKFQYNTPLKTKVRADVGTIVKEGWYQGDMFIDWNPEWEGVFFINQGYECPVNPMPQGKWGKKNHLFYCKHHCWSIVDVKGTFKNKSHAPLTRAQQLCAVQDTYVQKVIPLGPKGLFRKTFCPTEELYTPKKKQRRAHYKTLKEYLLHCTPINGIPKGLIEWRENQTIY